MIGETNVISGFITSRARDVPIRLTQAAATLPAGHSAAGPASEVAAHSQELRSQGSDSEWHICTGEASLHFHPEPPFRRNRCIPHDANGGSLRPTG